jgi:hypothetical protein
VDKARIVIVVIVAPRKPRLWARVLSHPLVATIVGGVIVAWITIHLLS